MDNKKYIAFISYKEEDYEMAKWLQHKLEHYHLPSIIRKDHPDLPQIIKPVFEYKSEMAGGFLEPGIKHALNDSKYLIVVCSPNAPQSPWVAKEVQHFIDAGRTDYIIPFVIAGKANSENPNMECFPKPLRELKEQLRGISIYELGRDAAAVKVVAQMFRLDFDVLWQRYERERKRKVRLTIIGINAFAVVALGIAVWIWKQNWKLLENQSRFVAEKAQTLIENDSYLARLLAVEVLPKDLNHPKRPYTPEAEFVLRQSITRPMVTLGSHNASVKTVDISTDGHFVLSASADGTIKLWDITTGFCKQTLNGHNDVVRCAKFRKDNKYIVSASGDHTVRIWDVKSGQCLNSLIGHTNQVWYAAFSNEGKQIASASADRTIKIWDIDRDSCTSTLIGHKLQVNSVEWNSKDTYLVSASLDKTIKLWDLTADSCKLTMEGHTGAVNCAVFSPDDKYIASASCDGTIRIWDFNTGLCVDTLIGHDSCVNSIKYSYDGMCIVSASADKTIKIWNTLTKSVQTLEGHFRSVSDVDFSPDCKLVVSCSGDRTIRVWNITENNPINFRVSSLPVDCYAQYGSDGKRIAYQVSSGILGIWDMESNSSIFNTQGTWGYPSFAYYGRLFATISNSEDSIKVWDIEANHCKNIITDIGAFGRSLAFSPNGDYLAYYSNKGITIQNVYDSQHKILLDRSSGYKDKITYSPNGKYLCAQSGSIIRIWNAYNGCCVLDYERKQMRGYAFHPYENIIVIGSGVGLIIVDIETKKEIRILDEYAGFTNWDGQPCFSFDGKYLISHSGKTIHIRDYKSGFCIQDINNIDAFINSVDISPNGKCIMAGLNDGTICIWDLLPLQDLIDQTRERFKDRPLTPEERHQYYLE